ncbi:uncharacterized protein [Amphiura filiformis]|uniref:uncharacterized protein isoform X3 n=1 Tax=Amphiura filiformis TaxID=82378 RepID=UPI003B215582
MSMNVARPGSKMGNRNDQRGGGHRGPPNRNPTQNRNQGGGPQNRGPNKPRNDQMNVKSEGKDNGNPNRRGGDRDKPGIKSDPEGMDQDSQDGEAGTGRRQEKKFTQRCRLFVGNLTPDTSEDEFKEMFRKYGEVSEVFLNKSKGFGFIRLDTRFNAEVAKAELDGIMRKGRTVRVRFATHGAALRVKNIPQSCSNELLADAFSQFGVVERAIVVVDDRGRPTGDGIVEFARKPGAQNALTRIREGVFLISSVPTPLTVEPLEQKDEEDGQQEKNIQKNQQYHREREMPPRFAAPGSFEYEWGMRWKQIEDQEKMQREQLERQIEENRHKLDDDMENAKHEHQMVMMRQDLLRRQEELQRLEKSQEEFALRRQEMQRQRQEQRAREEQMLRQQQEEAMVMRRRQDEARLQQDLRRRNVDDIGSRDQGMMQMRGMFGGKKGGPPSLVSGGGNNSVGGGNGNGAGGPSANQGGGGGGGNQGGGMGLGSSPGQGFQRQSRFDQPPGMGGGPGGREMLDLERRGGPGGPGGRGPGGPGGPGGMGGPGFGGPRGGMDEMRGTRRPPMDRPDMERGGRDHRDDYGKRPRRF